MKNGFENCSLQNDDTLLFLINEFFLNSNLSSIESSSEHQDNEISLQMDKLYRNSLLFESLKTTFYAERQFKSHLNYSTGTFLQCAYQVNNSAVKQSYYRRLFNKDDAMNNKKIILKSNLNTTGKKNDRNQGLCLTDANKRNISRKKGNLSAQSKMPNYHRDMNYTNNKSNQSSQRSDFKFEPKKKRIMNCIKNAEIPVNKHQFTPRKGISSASSRDNLKLSNYKSNTKKITSEGKIDKLFSNEKNENIIRKIVLFLNFKNNHLRIVNSLTRSIYLEELMNETQRKIDLIQSNSPSNDNNHPANQSKEMIDTSGSSCLDNKMQIEILKHIEAKISEFIIKK